MARGATLVLTYHSIAEGTGPTSIPAPVFRAQMQALADAGYRALTVADFLAWRRGEGAEAGRRVLITFDDGFLDFVADAHPALKAHGFPALMFVPTGKLGGVEDWDMGTGRPLMSWAQAVDLAADGVEFGAHGVGHRDLTRLTPEERRLEIAASGAELGRALGKPVRAFAAPYGRVDAAVLAELAGAYELAFGVRLGLARRDDPAFDVPRVEMHYFRDLGRWRAFLDGDDRYFNRRRALRGLREGVARVFRGR